jgi:hypothetical protein
MDTLVEMRVRMPEAVGSMTRHQLEQRCRKVIAEAIAEIENATDETTKNKWRAVRNNWQELLNNVRFGPRPAP